MNLKIARNFPPPIGRNHLTRDGKTTLCNVPLTNEAYPAKPAKEEDILAACLECRKRLQS